MLGDGVSTQTFFSFILCAHLLCGRVSVLLLVPWTALLGALLCLPAGAYLLYGKPPKY
jgi:hypothetical protein